MEDLIGMIIWFVIIGGIVLACLIKKVPANTLIIIDRNGHFHKKKRHGFYILSSRDKVTTYLSSYDSTQYFINTFETHSSTFYRVYFSVTYKSEDLDRSAQSLEDSRRSVYDIINCAAEPVVGSSTTFDTFRSGNFETALFKQLESTLEPFYIDVKACKLITINSVAPSIGQTQKFQKHVSSSGGDNPFI